MKIKVVFKNFEFLAELNDTNIAKKIYNVLPIETRVQTWGQEIYFKIPVKCDNEKPTLDVNIGDLAYWSEGECFCIFFGRTPISTTDKPVPYSEVNVIGKFSVEKNIIENLKKINRNSKIKILKVES